MSEAAAKGSAPEKMEPNPHAQAWKTLSPLIFGHSAAMTLKTAVLLDIPDIIAKAGPGNTVSLQELAAQLPGDGVDQQALYRVMRVLVHYGIFTAQRVPQSPAAAASVRYGMTPAAQMLVRHNNAGSVAHNVLFLNHKAAHEACYHLCDTVLHGTYAWQAAHGKDCWEYSEDDPEFKRLLDTGVEAQGRQILGAILKDYEGFEDVKVLVDAGGGTGQTVAGIVAAHPHIHGINYDLPRIVEDAATKYPGVEHIAGSVLDSIPNGDTIFMKNVIHIFDHKRALKILENCRRAIPADGKVLIYDPIIPSEEEGAESPYNSVQPEADLLLMVHTKGVDRTEAQWRTFLAEGGFPNVNFIRLQPPHWLIEARQ